MKILFLGSDSKFQKRLINFLIDDGNFVMHLDKKINSSLFKKYNFDFLISYGYRFIIDKYVINHFGDRAINLHISYLPWNRGADPNLWSFVDDTPKGVSIHIIDEGIDTGPIIFQEKIVFDKKDTLATSYEKLQKKITYLFTKKWSKIKSSDFLIKEQRHNGSYHKSSDKNKITHLIKYGWDTMIQDLKQEE